MSLLHTVKKMNKNYIIFNYQNTEYYEPIDNDNKINIFNKNLMNIFLDQFTERIGRVTYDDIIVISVLENHDAIITNLPNKLKHLIVMSTFCRSLELNNEVCLSIEHISIDKSNITNFPDIRNCINLKTCKINHSAIDNLHLSYDLPNSLFELNLQTNLIENTNFSYEKLLDKLENNTLKKINLSDNYLDYNKFPVKLACKCNLIRQRTYIHNQIVTRNVANLNIANVVNNIRLNGDTLTHNLFSSQNVHLSSINKSIVSSVNNMLMFISVNNIKPVILELNQSILSILKNAIFSHYIISINSSDQELFLNYYTRNIKIKSVISSEFDILTKNSVTNLTYKETFELIWSILCFEYRKGKIDLHDAFDRMETEIIDGSKLCYTGKYNRLINSMVGLIEGVHVGFSEGEELQLEFGKLLERFNTDKTYTFNKLYCDSNEVLQFIKSQDLKQPWIDAINDLKPEPEIIKYNNQEYFKTWDYDVLELYERTLVGYYLETQDKIIYLNELL